MDQKMILESAKELAPDGLGKLPSLALMTGPPLDPEERRILGGQMWTGIVARFAASLCEQDRELLYNPAEHVEKSPEHLRVMRSLDDFLLRRVAEWGWRVLMSVEVLQRISEWEKHSPALLMRLGEELALRSKVLRGEKSAPLPADLHEFADGAIEEINRLLRRQREIFRSARRGVSCETIAEWMQSEINSRPTEFPLLTANLAQLCGFVHNLAKRDRAAAQMLRRGDTRARGFFYLWFATCSNRNLKDIRNEMARRRAEHRRLAR